MMFPQMYYAHILKVSTLMIFKCILQNIFYFSTILFPLKRFIDPDFPSWILNAKIHVLNEFRKFNYTQKIVNWHVYNTFHSSNLDLLKQRKYKKREDLNKDFLAFKINWFYSYFTMIWIKYFFTKTLTEISSY